MYENIDDIIKELEEIDYVEVEQKGVVRNQRYYDGELLVVHIAGAWIATIDLTKRNAFTINTLEDFYVPSHIVADTVDTLFNIIDWLPIVTEEDDDTEQQYEYYLEMESGRFYVHINVHDELAFSKLLSTKLTEKEFEEYAERYGLDKDKFKKGRVY